MPTQQNDDELVRATLAAVAPGTELRDGLERILRGRTGALIVLGNDKVVETVSTGGFPLDVEFSATRLRELAKMDGAIVCDREVTRIVRAATQLLPDPRIETSESGTRHRTAERVAKQTGFPVISVSQSMRIIALYIAGRRVRARGLQRHPVAAPTRPCRRSSATSRASTRSPARSRRSRSRTSSPSATSPPCCSASRWCAASRTRSPSTSCELGTDGRLLALQLDELTGGCSDDLGLVIRDYLPEAQGPATSLDEAIANLEAIDSTELLDPAAVARAVGFTIVGDSLDSSVSPLGHRLLSKVPRLPGAIVDRLVSHFGSLQKLLAANIDDLMAVDGVGERRARLVREGLSRLAESSILERYV